ncbi:hypothetical protein B0T26DRAFT_669773 [Lasiosphaeria miniovina]|uniref:Extracellular membrane protein CFEM domain-containing protein n=1 Tax=Lasiosphaeria miniovina TaxID=1954250 RepID=A0AA40BG76_9PEZI|nr:uncharacterized protein B0T26DRAFT_669773 [Lasiosphaeria miniovina]KAK0733358.1 hypothetical protein B0T26DRAFT_669773 [Lasiosphaeria miniovina]
MGFTRLALIGLPCLLSLLGQAELAASATMTPSFKFPTCVDTCAGHSGCQTDDSKCMCTTARSYFLETVVTCVYYNCKDDFPKVDGEFLNIMTAGCKGIKKPIPDSSLKAAKSVSKPTQSPSTQSTAVQDAPSSTLASAQDQQTSAAPAAATDASPPSPPSQPPPVVVTPSSSESPSSAADAPNPVLTDSSPFALPNSSGPQVGAMLFYGMGLPLLLAGAFTLR